MQAAHIIKLNVNSFLNDLIRGLANIKTMDFEAAKAKLDNKIWSGIIDTCSHCVAKVHIKPQNICYHTLDNGDVEFYVVFRCEPCQKLLLKTYYFRQKNPGTTNIDLKDEGWGKKFPVALDTEIPEADLQQYLPEEVLADYKEALNCKAIKANRASCVMFRRSLQSALVELKAQGDDLRAQINSLSELTEDIKDWAHEIRIFGNWGAHPDKDGLKNVTAEEVEEAHNFISKFLVYTFVMPRKVKESREKRQEKLNPGQE